MPYIDSHGRPELLVHPDIVGGPASWRTEPADVEKDAERPAPRRRRATGQRPTEEQSTGGKTE
jgi:hypothetical protein